jgi:hypothetical protein
MHAAFVAFGTNNALRIQREVIVEKIVRSFIIVIGALIIGFSPLCIDAGISDVKWTGVGQAQGLSYGKGATLDNLVIDAQGTVYVCVSATAGGILFNSCYVKWDGNIWSEWSGAQSVNGGSLDRIWTDKAGGLYGAWAWYDTSSRFALAQWDGNAWHFYDGRFNGPLKEMVRTRSGDIYVCGNFDYVGDISANHVAKWNNGQWHSLGNGIGGWEVNAMTSDDSGHIYAAGMFATAGNVMANNIVKWNGAAWAPLGNCFNDAVYDLAFDKNGILYAGGRFDSIGDVPVNNIATWDGTSWSALKNGVRSHDGRSFVDCLVSDDSGNLYIGGTFDTVVSVVTSGITKWDGNKWDSLGAGIDGHVKNISFDNKGNCFALGFFATAGGKPADYIAQWNGVAWSPVGQKDGNGLNGHITHMAADNAGNLYSIGDFTTAGVRPVKHVARWDGSAWTAVGGGLDILPNALAVDSTGTFYVTGVTQSGDSAILMQWDGTSWKSCGAGQLNGLIFSLVIDRTGIIYTGGSFTSVDSIGAHNVAKWDGKSWSALGSGIQGQVTVLTIDSKGVLYAGVSADTNGKLSSNYIAKWDGSKWSNLGKGFNGWLLALAADNKGNLYAGGTFNYVDSITAHHIAKWNGSEWSALGSGCFNDVQTILFDESGKLYEAGCCGDHEIRKWDGKTWSSLASGPDGDVNDLVIRKNMLYVGGSFSHAGGKASVNFALCTLDNSVRSAYSPPAKSPSPLFTYESAKGHVRVNLKSETIVDFRMYSLDGRLMYRFSENVFAGEHTFRLSAAKPAPGAYIAQVTAGSETTRWRTIFGRYPLSKAP